MPRKEIEVYTVRKPLQPIGLQEFSRRLLQAITYPTLSGMLQVVHLNRHVHGARKKTKNAS